MLYDSSAHQVFSIIIGEHKVMGILKFVTQKLAISIQLFLLVLQRFHDNRSRYKGTGVAILGCAEEIRTILALKLTVDGDGYSPFSLVIITEHPLTGCSRVCSCQGSRE